MCYTHAIPFRIRTVPRTVVSGSFSDEPKLPKLGNLTTHIKELHPELLAPDTAEAEAPSVSTSLHDHGYTVKAAKLMEDFVAEGALNPKLDPTRQGFLRVFAAWILEEDLPWNTGEAPRLKQLFEYLQIRFQLPTDTTVRNTLAKIFADLHAEVVKELAVRHCCFLSHQSWRALY